MPHKINIDKFISLPFPIFDVRSPIEFNKGHIPNSINLPLFTNEERAIVGTAYFKQGRSEAIKIGLEKVQSKLVDFIESVNSFTSNKDIRIHCWRGGLRSQNMAWLLKMAGYNVYLLDGGYKSYRNYVLKYFENKFPLIVIGGMTGVGKTEILNILKLNGEQVIDFEALANHKGSVFGHLGQQNQPTTEYFENLIFYELSKFSFNRPIWVEDESFSVGNVFINKSLFEQIIKSPIVVIERSENDRVTRLIDEYSHFDKDLLINAINRIERRIGGDICRKIIEDINNENFINAISTILKYYDRHYLLNLNNNKLSLKTFLNIDKLSNNEIISKLLEISEKIKYGTN